MYSKILVAYDGSKQSDKALNQAIAFCQEHPSTTLEVVYVFNIPNLVVGEAVIVPPPRLENEFYEHARAVVNKAKQLVAILPHASVVLKQGDPARTILDYAQETLCDLIIIGSRGLGGIREVMLGSVSHYVVQKSEIPVLVIK